MDKKQRLEAGRDLEEWMGDRYAYLNGVEHGLIPAIIRDLCDGRSSLRSPQIRNHEMTLTEPEVLERASADEKHQTRRKEGARDLETWFLKHRDVLGSLETAVLGIIIDDMSGKVTDMRPSFDRKQSKSD